MVEERLLIVEEDVEFNIEFEFRREKRGLVNGERNEWWVKGNLIADMEAVTALVNFMICCFIIFNSINIIFKGL